MHSPTLRFDNLNPPISSVLPAYLSWRLSVRGLFWQVLGMFLNPNRVGPFFAAVVGFVFHVTSYYRKLMNFFEEAKARPQHLTPKVTAYVPAHAKTEHLEDT